MTKYLMGIVMSLAILFVFTSCEEEGCDTTCPDGQIQQVDCSCFDPQSGITETLISGNITEDETWTSDKEYVLGGRIAIESGATLTIMPGTVVKGEFGAGGNASALLVAQGGTLNACGTADAPIIMTTVADEITSAMVAAGNFVSPNLETTDSGLWGGLIVLGYAPISVEGNGETAQIEGIPTSDQNGLYGGSDASDSSGSICYVSVRHGGANIGDGNEINGITFGGVGSGTIVDNVEVVANQDDGIEWFGGSVNVTNALVWGCGDDGLDTDQSWNGTCENWIVAVTAGGSAMELDGPEGDSLTGCNSFNNGTIYGANTDHIVDWDDATNTGITNLYITGIDSEYDVAAAFESFGGDGLCTSGAWEATVPSDAMMWVDAANGAITIVSSGNNTVGATNVFGWTLGGQSGALAALGL